MYLPKMMSDEDQEFLELCDRLDNPSKESEEYLELRSLPLAEIKKRTLAQRKIMRSKIALLKSLSQIEDSIFEDFK